MSRLQSRLGSATVLTLGLQADHRPERVLDEFAVGEKPSARRRTQEPPSLAGSVPPLRPGWLLQRPQRLPQLQLEQLQLLSGPERIVSGWWEQAAPEVQGSAPWRDYFIARWPDGRCGWLFRDRRGRWFLHGWFG